ncbi:helix-turn-helix domain-containing protein [Streptomyces sp. x-19]|uniref:helix-turn-helix domain-containing protein n=1 Tax=Streptomyces sp. x-19 TaxID=2789280 RepID=UPI00397EC1CF
MSRPSPPPSIQQAREALGKRLREIRQDAGLTARAVAAMAGWHESKSSRLENGKTAPSDEDIRLWTRICHVEAQAADLIATARGIDGLYVEWRRLERAGLKHVQDSVLPLYERTRWFRFYQSQVVPGLLQTREYTEAILRTVVALRDAPDDIEEASAARMSRQRVLHSGGRRFAFVVEEWVLRSVIGSPDIMVNQLGHLIGMTATPSLSMGVIPMGVVRGHAWPCESFSLYDGEEAASELVSASLTVTQPSEVAEYAKTFVELANLAVYGAAARKLIISALDALG